MKKLLSAVAGGLLILITPLFGQAAPFADPDFVIAGADYFQVDDPTRWIEPGDGSVVSPWGNHWIEFQAELTPGNWNIGLNAINIWGGLYSGWDYQFVVEVNGLASTMFTIPGSTTEVFNGYFNTDITTQGIYNVKFTWMNDEYEVINGVTYDANIQIVSAFFKDPPVTNAVPEPGTLLLLGSGLLGLGLVRNRKKNA